MYFARKEEAIKETDIKYGNLCFCISNNILRNDEDSMECLNDIYLGLWNAIPPERPNNLTAYICKIARNLSLKRLEFLLRQKRSQKDEVSLDDLEDILPDDSLNPEVNDAELGKLISKFLSGEKEEVRNVFIRKYFFFDSIGDIAKRYSFSESKVKSILFHTRNKLKDFLIKEGVVI